MSSGCIRVVHYTADAMGFQPTVTYEGDCANKSEGDTVEVRAARAARAGAAAAEPAAEAAAVTEEVASPRIARDLETMAMEVLDALIPAEDPVEINTEIPVADDDDDPAGDRVADPPGVVMDLVPVILPPASPNHISVLDAKLKASQLDSFAMGDDPDRVPRCWYPIIPPAPPVAIEQIPATEKQPEVTEAPPAPEPAYMEEEDDAVITESATGIPPPFSKAIRRPDVHSAHLIYDSPSPTAAPAGVLPNGGNVRTYVLRTPAKGGLFRQHPKLIPYKIKDIWQGSERQGPPPPGKPILPLTGPLAPPPRQL